VVANARAIRGAVGECLKLSDQLHDPELKAGAIGFVNGMEFIIASLLGEETRVRQRGASEKELIKRLHEELEHIRQLLAESDRTAHELGDSEAKRLLFTSKNRLEQFAGLIDRRER
jgi:hypothetical protein